MSLDDLDIDNIQEDIFNLQADVEEMQENLNKYLRGCPYECSLNDTINHILKEQKKINASIHVLINLLGQKGLFEPESFNSLVESKMKGTGTDDNSSK